jgi:hypothetical protein
MLIDAQSPYLIEKDNIATLRFPSEEVLSSQEEMKQRKADAQKGMILGNNYKS